MAFLHSPLCLALPLFHLFLILLFPPAWHNFFGCLLLLLLSTLTATASVCCLFVFLCLQLSTTLFFRLSPPKRGSPQKTRLLPTLLRQQNKQRCTKGREKNENRKKTNKQTNNVRTESPSSALHSYSLPPNAYRKTNSPSFSTGHLQDKIIIHEHQAASTKRCLDHLTDPVPVLTLSSQSFLFTISLLFLKVTTFPIHGLHGVTRPVRRRQFANTQSPEECFQRSTKRTFRGCLGFGRVLAVG